MIAISYDMVSLVTPHSWSHPFSNTKPTKNAFLPCWRYFVRGQRILQGFTILLFSLLTPVLQPLVSRSMENKIFTYQKTLKFASWVHHLAADTSQLGVSPQTSNGTLGGYCHNGPAACWSFESDTLEFLYLFILVGQIGARAIILLFNRNHQNDK